MRAPQCGLSWAGIFMHSCYLDRNFPSNTLQLVLHVEFNLKKNGIETKCFCFGISLLSILLKCDIEHERDFPQNRRFQTGCDSSALCSSSWRGTFRPYPDPDESWQLSGEYWFIFANGCAEALGGLCQSYWSCESSCIRLDSSLGVCLWSNHTRIPM